MFLSNQKNSQIKKKKNKPYDYFKHKYFMVKGKEKKRKNP